MKAKAITLIPERYSISSSIEETLKYAGIDCTKLNSKKALSKWELDLNGQMFRVTRGIRNQWARHINNKIYDWFVNEVNIILPDFVIIYNHEMITPDILGWLKEKKIKIIFILGDSPFFSNTSQSNFLILKYADLILSPDTYWKIQLEKTGLKNIHHFLFPLPEKRYYPIKQSDNENCIDAIYAGTCNNNSWGYKKAFFLNYFTDNNFFLYGNDSWNLWLPLFPKLKACFVPTPYVPNSKLNELYNSSKIVPVDGNAGIVNGLHIRIAETLASGVLPLMEWNADMDFVFEGIDNLPVIRDYREIPEILKWFLNNDEERKSIAQEMKEVYSEKYNYKTSSELICSIL